MDNSPNHNHVCQVDAASMLEVWKTLEALVVSLDRMGSYWNIYGREAAKEALTQYLNPTMFSRIATARRIAVEALEACDPTFGVEMERLAEEGSSIGYWERPAE